MLQRIRVSWKSIFTAFILIRTSNCYHTSRAITSAIVPSSLINLKFTPSTIMSKRSSSTAASSEGQSPSKRKRKSNESGNEESDFEIEIVEESKPKKEKVAPKKAKKSDNSTSSNDTSANNVVPPVTQGFKINRARLLTQSNSQPKEGDCVVLWMSRDQRVHDNYAMSYAKLMAQNKGVPLKVVFNLVPRFLEATIRHYGFMIKGLREVETTLRDLDIPFHLLMGNPLETIPGFVEEHNASMLVCDFSPMRVGLSWVQGVAQQLNTKYHGAVPLVQVDAHNIVPCWVASNKLEYGARTIRSKIQRLLPEYMEDMAPITSNPEGSLAGCESIDWDAALASLEINRDVKEVDWIKPGTAAAHAMVQEFITHRLKDYADKRNDPNNNFQSHLSPYIHFGQISVQRIVLILKQLKKYPSSVDSFVEEAVVRRELTDNFCFYNSRYDSLDSCYDWAKETLAKHASDPRPVVYNLQQLETAMTHDDLWNAAQIQMNTEGKMHGFLRMYWAKKILEWTQSPQEALQFAIYLNDKYSLDGRDPNGYVGCMWSIGGIHDQGWGERAIFGKIRYMNYDGCKRKFDVKKFVSKYPPAARNAAQVTGQRTINYAK